MRNSALSAIHALVLFLIALNLAAAELCFIIKMADEPDEGSNAFFIFGFAVSAAHTSPT